MLAALETQQIPYLAHCDGDQVAHARLRARQSGDQQSGDQQSGNRAVPPAQQSWAHINASQDNHGLLAARLQAWRALCDQPRFAQFDYVINFDPDDLLAETCGRLLAEGAAVGADVIEFNAHVIRGAKIRPLYKGPYGAYLRYWGAEAAFMDRRMRFSVWSKLVRTSVWEQVCTRLEVLCDGALPHLTNGEDIVWTWLLSQEAQSWRYINQPLYGYQVHPQSASHRIAASLARKKYDDIRMAHRLIRRDLARRDPLNRNALLDGLARIEVGNLNHSVVPSYLRLTPDEQGQLFSDDDRRLLARAGALRPRARSRCLASYGREFQAMAAAVTRPRQLAIPRHQSASGARRLDD